MKKASKMIAARLESAGENVTARIVMHTDEMLISV
jgi:hypothetical protein